MAFHKHFTELALLSWMFSVIVNSKQLLTNVYTNYFLDIHVFALQKLAPKYYLSVRQGNNFLSWDLNASPLLPNTQLNIWVELIQILASTYKVRMNWWGVNARETVNWLARVGRERGKRNKGHQRNFSLKIIMQDWQFWTRTGTTLFSCQQGLRDAGGIVIAAIWRC